jgi:hypothetical protein
LDRKALIDIADAIDVALDRHNTNAEPIGIGFGQFRDVASNFAIFAVAKILIKLFESGLQRLSHGVRAQGLLRDFKRDSGVLGKIAVKKKSSGYPDRGSIAAISESQ